MIALILMLLAATGASIHFHARPHLFTLVLLTIAVWLLEYNRQRGGRLVWALVPITVLWANLHGGFFIFFVLLGLRVAGCAGEAMFWPEERLDRRKECIQLAWLGLACAAASLLNPYGYRLHAHIFETLSSPWIMANVSEFRSPSFRSEEMYDIMFLLFAGLASIVPLVRKRMLVEPLWIVFLAYCSLISVRHGTIYLLVATPIVASEISEWWESLAARKPKTSVIGMLHDFSCQLSAGLPGTSLLIPAFIVILMITPGIKWPKSFPDGQVPVTLIERHSDMLATSRVFSTDQVADYLIFRNYPRQRVFMDSRHNYYGEKIGNDFIAINNGLERWKTLIDQYDFTVILCESDGALASLMRVTAGWRLVDRSKGFILFRRDSKS